MHQKPIGKFLGMEVVSWLQRFLCCCFLHFFWQGRRWWGNTAPIGYIGVGVCQFGQDLWAIRL